ncbi:hypothetical protein AB2N08_09355 [Massilia aurea]|uniref:hypothetical protein n=1 Tax=Massilia aurea TaxID=373040 RepID=UPI003461C622
MIIDLPGFDFEKPHTDTSKIETLFKIIRHFLDTKGISRNEYALGAEIAAGLGELVMKEESDFFVVYTTERGANFDAAIFSSSFHAVNYFIFRLTGEKETIDWSSI